MTEELRAEAARRLGTGEVRQTAPTTFTPEERLAPLQKELAKTQQRLSQLPMTEAELAPYARILSADEYNAQLDRSLAMSPQERMSRRGFLAHKADLESRIADIQSHMAKKEAFEARDTLIPSATPGAKDPGKLAPVITEPAPPKGADQDIVRAMQYFGLQGGE